MDSLARPCISLSLSLVMFPLSCRLRIAVDRFGAVVFPLHSPLIRSKLCPFFILATWMFAIFFSWPDLFTFELVEYPEGALCVRRWRKVFGESSSFASFLLAYNIVFRYILVMLLAILYSTIFIKLKTQAHPGEQSTNSQQQQKRLKKQKRSSNVHCYSNSVCALLVTFPY